MSNTKITLGDVRIFRAGKHSDVSICLSQEILAENSHLHVVIMNDIGELMSVIVDSVRFIYGELL